MIELGQEMRKNVRVCVREKEEEGGKIREEIGGNVFVVCARGFDGLLQLARCGRAARNTGSMPPNKKNC